MAVRHTLAAACIALLVAGCTTTRSMPATTPADRIAAVRTFLTDSHQAFTATGHVIADPVTTTPNDPGDEPLTIVHDSHANLRVTGLTGGTAHITTVTITMADGREARQVSDEGVWRTTSNPRTSHPTNATMLLQLLTDTDIPTDEITYQTDATGTVHVHATGDATHAVVDADITAAPDGGYTITGTATNPPRAFNVRRLGYTWQVTPHADVITWPAIATPANDAAARFDEQARTTAAHATTPTDPYSSTNLLVTDNYDSTGFAVWFDNDNDGIADGRRVQITDPQSSETVCLTGAGDQVSPADVSAGTCPGPAFELYATAQRFRHDVGNGTPTDGNHTMYTDANIAAAATNLPPGVTITRLPVNASNNLDIELDANSNSVCIIVVLDDYRLSFISPAACMH